MQNFQSGITCDNHRTSLSSPESIIGLATIASFYTGEIVGLRVTLQVGAMLAACLLFAIDLSRRDRKVASLPRHRLAAYLLFLTFVGMFLSFAFSILRDLEVRDLGLFFLQGVVALVILLSPRNSKFAFAVGTWAVPFALIDAIVNFAGFLNLIDIQRPARIIDGAVSYSYPGLSGNLLAAGFIAFVAIARLLHDFIHQRKRRTLIILTIAIIFLSLELIDARRFTGLALAVVALFVGWRFFSKIGLHWAAIAVSGIFLFLSFRSVELDQSNSLRGQLLNNGLSRALEHPFLGTGPAYQNLEGLNATFEDLAYAGVTESHFLDRAISYGGISALAFVFAALLVLANQRQQRPAFLPIVLTCLVAEQFVGNTLSSLSGVVLFFGCIGAYLWPKGEESQASKAHLRPAPN